MEKKKNPEIKSDFLLLRDAARYCDYSQEYLSLRARQGKLKAVKFGRNWMTRKEWIEEYVRKVEEYNRKVRKTKPEPLEEVSIERVGFFQKIFTPSVFKLRPALALALIFLLLFSSIVLGKESLKTILQETIFYVQQTTKTINHVLKESKKSLASSLDSLNQSFINVAQVIKTTDYEDFKEPIPLFKEYFKWLGNSLKTVFVQKPKALVKGILDYGNYLAKKIKKGFKKLVLEFQTKTKELKELVTKPWKIIPEKPPKEPEKPVLVEVTKEEFEKLKQEIQRIKEEGLPVREIIKEIEVSKVTKVEPIKEITKEIKILDDESLKIIRASLLEQETDVEKLKLAASAGYVNVIFPTTLPLEGDTSIIILGTISTGTWNGDVITTTYGGTGANLSTGAQGGLVYMGASSIMGISAAGTSGYALISGGTGVPTWTNTPSWSTLTLSTSATSPIYTGTGAVEVSSGGAEALTLDSASGTVQLATGDSLTVPGTITGEGQLIATKAPTKAHTGTWSVDSDTWHPDDATIYINPSSATGDSNLLGLAVNGFVKFAIDAEGDIFGRNLILEGSTSAATTTITGDLKVEGNTTLGDTSTDTLTFNASTLAIANNLNIDSDTLFIDASGNMVGIGTTGPDSKLHIVGGDVYIAPDSGYTFDNTSTDEDLYVHGNLEVDSTIYGATLNLSGLTASRLLATDASKNLASVANLTSWIAGTANELTVSNDGDGTVSLSLPGVVYLGASGKLGRDADNLIDFTTDDQLTWRVNAADELRLTGSALYPVTDKGLDLGTSSYYWNNLYLAGGTIYFDDTTDATLKYDTTNGEFVFDPDGDGTANVVFEDGGNVGIGTDSPGAKLDISLTNTAAGGEEGIRALVYQDDSTALTGTLRGAYFVATNGQLAATGTIRGAEIKARAAKSDLTGANVTTLEGLSVSADAKNKTVGTLRGAELILDGQTDASVTEAVGLRIANNFQADIATTSYGLQIYRDSFDYTADIQLSSGGLIGGSSGHLTIDSSGNVGIGTTGPDRKLDIFDTSNPQLRLSQANGTVYTEFQVVATTGDLIITPSGNDITIPDDNLWVCGGGSCPDFMGIGAGRGNLVIEKNLYVGDSTTDFMKMYANNSTGAIEYYGKAKPKRSIILTAAGAITPTTGGAAKTQIDGSNHSYYVLDFDDSSDEAAYWHWIMPDSYDGGNIEVAIYWFAGATSGNVVWAVQTTGVDINEVYDASLGTAQTVIDGTNGTANTLNSATLSAFSPGWVAEDEIIFQVFRDANSDSDDMIGDARFVKVRIEYSVAQESD